MFTLIIEDSAGAIAEEYQFSEGEFIIGRGTGNDIILPSDNVSRKHARLFTQAGKIYVEDLGSSNGIFINGKRAHKVTEVALGAQVKVGDFYLHIDGGDVGRASRSDDGTEHAQGPAGSEIFGRLVGTNGPVQGKPFDLTRSVNLVGRGKDCAITVVDASISRVHAKVLRHEDGTLHVEDLKSSNGSYINDQRVTHGAFSHGDRIRFGNVEFICEMPGSEGEVIEVSSGGRKGLLFLSLFIFMLLATGGTLAWVFRDKLFGSGVTEEEAKAIRGQQEQAASAERDSRLSAAKTKLVKLVGRAQKLAAADDWAEAEKLLKQGAAEAEGIAADDEKGELRGYLETAEGQLRADRAEVDAIVDGLALSDWASAGKALERLIKRGGPMLELGKAKIDAKRGPWLTEADAAEKVEKNLAKAIELYKRAAGVNPTDKTLTPLIATLEAQLAAQPPVVPAAPVPTEVPVPAGIPAPAGVPLPPPSPDPGAPAAAAPAPVVPAPAEGAPAPVAAPVP